MVRSFLLILLIFSFLSGLGASDAQELVDAKGKEAASLVGTLRDAMYTQIMDVDALYRLYRVTLADLIRLDLSKHEVFFWEAQSAYYLGRVYQNFVRVEDVFAYDRDFRRGKGLNKLQKHYPQLEKTVLAYEKSLSRIEEYLKLGRDARGLVVYAESLSQLSVLKGLGFLLSNGPKISILAEEILSLDPRNVKASILLAARYIYSPLIWGGAPDQGIAILQEILQERTLDPTDQHNIAISIGFAHTRKKRWEEALLYFRRARVIYPTNIYAQAMIQLAEAEAAS